MATEKGSTAEIEVRELIEAWARAVKAGDIDGTIANHARDVVFFDVPPPPQIRGADAYRKSFEEFSSFVAGSGLFEFRELSVTAGDEVAFAHGIIRCRGGGSGQEEFPVRLSVGLRKTDGRWTVTHEHHAVPANS